MKRSFTIEMPEGSSFRSYIQFEVHNTDDYGEKIVKLKYQDFVEIAYMLAAHQKRVSESLTDLPHSPARTVPNTYDNRNKN